MMALSAISRCVRDLFNAGDEALNIPPLDGPLKPNDLVDRAEVLASVPDVDNVFSLERGLMFTAGGELCRLAGAAVLKERTFPQAITAALPLAEGGIALALDGHGVRVLGGARDGLVVEEVGGAPLGCVTDLAEVDGALVLTEGSLEHRAQDWLPDLMSKRRAGRVCRIHLTTGRGEVLAEGLGWPAGVCAADAGGEVLVSVAWEHRLVRLAATPKRSPLTTVWKNMPGYPGRLRHRAGGGSWLAVFAMRTKLVEFVLQENRYRALMMKHIDRKYWIAPALASLADHWEPLQGGGLRKLGVVQPWAPPRSYGLVVQLDRRGEPVGSLHSRAGQHRHGITSVVEHSGSLVFTSKGNGLLLSTPLDQAPRRTA